ncbi:GumC family protein [Craurococcus roseus]
MNTYKGESPMGTRTLVEHRDMPERVIHGTAAVDQEHRVPQEIWAAIRRRKWLIAGVFLLTFASATAVAFSLPPSFRASSTILLEARRVTPVKQEDTAANPPLSAEAVADELQVLQSRDLLEQLVQRLDLLQEPEFNRTLRPSRLIALANWGAEFADSWAPAAVAGALRDLALLLTERRDAEFSGTALDITVESLQRALQIRPIARSRAIQIGATAPTAEMAAAIANALADLYISSRTAQREAELRDVSNWVHSQLGQLRAQADASARAVVDFRVSHGLVRGIGRDDRNADLVLQDISDVASQLTAVRARQAEQKARLRQAEANMAAGNFDAFADVLNSRTIQTLRGQEAQVAGRSSELAARFGPGHPSFAAAAAELTDIRRRLSLEAGRILQGFRSDVRITEENEAALAQQLERLRAEVGRMNILEVRMQELQREADADRMLTESFLARARQISAEVGFREASARLVSRASLPRRPYSPNLLLLLPLSFIGSLGAAGLVALLRESASKGLRSFDELERRLGLVPLGMLPLRRRSSGSAGDVFFNEAVAGFCAHLVRRPGGTRPQSVLITSTLPGEGKSTTARCLAAEAGARGMRVVLVEADLRRPMVGRDGIVPRGLSDVLRGHAALDEVLRHVPERGHWVLPSGARPSNPTQLLTSEEMDRVLRRLEQTYDLVLVDSAPILVGGDVAALTRSVAETILLVRWGRTGWRAVAAALRRVAVAGGAVTGVVMTMVDTRKNAQYHHGEAVLYSPQLQRYYEPRR